MKAYLFVALVLTISHSSWAQTTIETSIISSYDLGSKSAEDISHAAYKDVMHFRSSGVLSSALENSVRELKNIDSSLTDEEAINKIFATVQ